MKKAISVLLIVGLLLSILPVAHSISAKTGGKLVLVAVLAGVGVLTRHLIKRDKRTVEDLRAQLGEPDHVVEFEEGFDRWRVERYDDQYYFFRNNVLHKVSKKK